MCNPILRLWVVRWRAGEEVLGCHGKHLVLEMHEKLVKDELLWSYEFDLH
jgi:hypothetical protein